MGVKKWSENRKLSKASQADHAEARAELFEEIENAERSAQLVRYRADAEVLEKIGNALQNQNTVIEVVLPTALADQAKTACLGLSGSRSSTFRFCTRRTLPEIADPHVGVKTVLPRCAAGARS